MRKLTIISLLLCCVVSFSQENAHKSKIDLENEFLATITDTLNIPLPSEECYRKISGNVYVAEGGSYMIENVRCDTFATSRDGTLVPLMTWSFPEESVKTMLTTPFVCENITLKAEHLKYGFESAYFEVNLKSLLSSCIHYGCIPYVGISGISDNAVEASLFLVNTKEEYNHILKLHIPRNVINRKKGSITGSLHTYVPMGNIDNLYVR